MAADTADASQYNGGDLLVTIVMFQVLTWISVALRTYVRTSLTKNFQTDDWLMLVAQVCRFLTNDRGPFHLNGTDVDLL